MTDSFDAPPAGTIVNLSGQTIFIGASGTTTLARVNSSGALLVDATVTANANISGQTVYLASGQNPAQISGQVVLISGQTVVASVTTNISGQTVYFASGQNMVQNSGQTVIAKISGETVVASVTTNISGQTVYLVSGQNAVQNSGQTIIAKISGETVVANVVTNISGQTVYLASGQNAVQMSGQLVAVSGIVGANVSGNAVRTSGEMSRPQFFDPSGAQWLDPWTSASGVHRLLVAISGETVVASVTTNISGQTVYLASGQNDVQISGQLVAVSGVVGANVSGNTIRNQFFDPSGATWLDAWMSASGVHRLLVAISGETVVASVTTNISGQTVYLASGNNDVQISGQLVAVSGLIGTSVSGNMVSISGQVVTASGISVVITDLTNSATVNTNYSDSMSTTDNPLVVRAGLAGYDQVTDQFKRVRVTASGEGMSGILHRLAVAVSGDPVSISGQPVSISGNMVSVSGQPVSVSGNAVAISGQFVNISGEIIQPRIPVQIRTRDTLLITGGSGGVALLSGDVLRVTVRNIGVSGTVMYVGGSGDYPWVASGQANFPFQSGRGFWLRDGDGITIHTSNMAFVRVVSHTSGEHVSYLGEQY